MDLIQLGPLHVSRLCLGTMLMGGRTPPDEAPAILDAFLAAGHNFLDTADTYGDGTSERTLAPWLAKRRSEVVLATKVRFDVSDPGGSGLAPERIAKACDASLRRLGVDVIDLYQLHAPDTAVALEDTLGALDALVRAGKVRALGASNFPAWLLAWAVAVQDREGFAPFVALQPQYSLVERSIEIELLPFCLAAGLGVLPWGPLGAGFLTGRYEQGVEPTAGTRIGDATDDLEEALDRRGTEANFRAVEEVRAVAGELGATPPQVAIAWLLAQPGVTAPIIGPRTLEQLEDLLPAADLRLSAEQLERLSRWTAPPLGYPQRMLLEQSGIDVSTIRLRRPRAANVRESVPEA
jgi:aryl-alcohol dehydrogenase-like predicted oxidoreductase